MKLIDKFRAWLDRPYMEAVLRQENDRLNYLLVSSNKQIEDLEQKLQEAQAAKKEWAAQSLRLKLWAESCPVK